MNYLLDTNVIVGLFRKRTSPVHRRFRSVREQNIVPVLSTIALFELHFGISKSDRPDANARILDSFVAAELEIVPFIEEDAVIAGELRWLLESQGRRIGPYDLLIAAQALRTGSTLVTANVSEFSRVPELVWEDWTRPA